MAQKVEDALLLEQRVVSEGRLRTVNAECEEIGRLAGSKGPYSGPMSAAFG